MKQTTKFGALALVAASLFATNAYAVGGQYLRKGKNMRHPAMPRFMKFNGTVIFSDTGLNIRGCALGICKAEDWTKK